MEEDAFTNPVVQHTLAKIFCDEETRRDVRKVLWFSLAWIDCHAMLGNSFNCRICERVTEDRQTCNASTTEIIFTFILPISLIRNMPEPFGVAP